MASRKWIRAKKIAVLVAAIGATSTMLPSTSYAGVDTATIHGIVKVDTAAKAGVEVIAVSKDDGRTYKTTTHSDGSYVLPGVAPGTYEIRISGSAKSEAITVHVGEEASLDLVMQADAPEKIVIVGSVQRANVKTSEVSTVVSPELMATLPQVTRNFLTFADIAPGVRASVDNKSGYVTLQNGAQNQDNVNVYIDGVSQKNYILRGGLTGMDSSRGNPFPQSAVAEYRVVSQNYKAEYDQVSSVAINAITKSGTNELHGDVFWDRSSTNWSAISPFETKDRPNVKQDQYGFSLGGPIKPDVAHFFVAYEAKNIDTPRQFTIVRQDLINQYGLDGKGVVGTVVGQQGTAVDKFKEDLFLAKADARLSENQTLEITARIRRESDLVPEDQTYSTPGNQKDRKNDETRFDVKHTVSWGDWMNEVGLGYEDAPWQTIGRASGTQYKYFLPISAGGDLQNQNTATLAIDGGSADGQKREQKGVRLQNDLTFMGLADHTMKGGVMTKRMTFDLSGTASAVDVVSTVIDPATGLPHLDTCANATITTCRINPAIPAVGVSLDDNMYGIYFQDDWEVNNRLELNLGARWDYEDNMLNNSYVTPADRVAQFNQPDTRNITDANGNPISPSSPTQTFGQSLAKGGININDYISTGSSRKAYKKALAPRLGFSYDLAANKDSVVFGAIGRAYDRKMANNALDELQKNAVSGPNADTWLIKNDFKVPYTDQLALGFRQRVGIWNGEVGYTYAYAHNQFTWFSGNRDPQGGFGPKVGIDPLWGGSFQSNNFNLVLGDFVTEAKTTTVYLKADKPYTKESGWGVTTAYTYSDGQTTNRAWTNDTFNWAYGKPGAQGWNPSVDVEKHRLVATGMTDAYMPFGLVVSGKLTLGSGQPYQVTDCTAGWDACVYHKGEGTAFRQFDVGVSKDIPVAFGKIVVRGDILNLFNTINSGGYDGWVGGHTTNPQNRYGGDNAHFGAATSVVGVMRTVKLTLRYAF